MGMLSVSEFEFSQQVIAAAMDSIMSGQDCFIHVERETGHVSWSRYKKDEMLSHREFHLSCDVITGQIWEEGEVMSREIDVERVLHAQQERLVAVMKDQLIENAADSMYRVDWLP